MPRTRSTKAAKVAIIGTRGYPSYYGGFETAVRKIAPYLADQGWDVSVYGRRREVRLVDPDGDQRVASILTPGINSNSLSTLSFGFTACLHAFLHKPDVALVMNVANGYWIPLLKLRGIPTVVNVDGIEWHRAKWGWLAKAMFRWGARLTAKFADQLIFDARAIEDFWRQEFGRTGTFIPYGGDMVGVLPVEPGLESRKYALMVARFVPENTISEFVEAAEDVSNEFDVVLVGSAPERSTLHREVSGLVKRNDRVHWLGHISDDQRLCALWQHAGAYFHGHSVGGTNPALVQAMAVGAAIVARDTVYNREVLAEAGTYVQPTAESIASGLKAMIQNSQSFRLLAYDRAADAYTWSAVCSRYAALLTYASRFESDD
jgi:glycosyltransferase involved in cell wall biosynthesis